jgi:hypothetical protein
MYGRSAVEAYIACADLYLRTPKETREDPETQPWPDDYYFMQAADATIRAWRIACGLGDRQLIAAAETAALATVARMEEWTAMVEQAKPRHTGQIRALITGTRQATIGSLNPLTIFNVSC